MVSKKKKFFYSQYIFHGRHVYIRELWKARYKHGANPVTSLFWRIAWYELFHVLDRNNFKSSNLPDRKCDHISPLEKEALTLAIVSKGLQIWRLYARAVKISYDDGNFIMNIPMSLFIIIY